MIFAATLLGFSIAMTLMAVGLLFGRKRLRRTCGAACDCTGTGGTEREGLLG